MRLLQIKFGRERRLVHEFTVSSASHALSHPTFGVAWAFCLHRRIGSDMETTHSLQRVSSRNEPSLKLTIGQDDRQSPMRNNLLSPPMDVRTEIFGAVIVGIQHDQDPTLFAAFGCGQKQLPFEFIRLVQKPVTPDPNRWKH